MYHYTNYRVFLKDFFLHRKSLNPRFSLRMFARQAGFSSHAFLPFLFAGTRNLSKPSAVKLAQAMKLGKRKAEFFEALVFFNQARTREEKNLFYEQLLRVVPKESGSKLQGGQFQIFRKWYLPVIREMVNLRRFRGHPQWIGPRLIRPVSPEEIREALDLLVSSGMLVKTAGGFAMADKNLATDDEVSPLFVKNYHHEMINMALKAMDEVPGDERDISAAGFSIRKEDFPKLKKHIQLMRKELFQFQAKDGEGDAVIQVNIQLIPMTREA